MLLATKPFDYFHGFYKTGKRKGFQHLLVMNGVFSNFIVVVPMKDQNASTVAKSLLEKWIFDFGPPVKLHSDQGKSF